MAQDFYTFSFDITPSWCLLMWTERRIWMLFEFFEGWCELVIDLHSSSLEFSMCMQADAWFWAVDYYSRRFRVSSNLELLALFSRLWVHIISSISLRSTSEPFIDTISSDEIDYRRFDFSITGGWTIGRLLLLSVEFYPIWTTDF